jgi:hypothetical protein
MVDWFPKSRAPGPWVAVLCLAALLVGDLFRGFHLLSAHHVVCAEHGELVHAGEAGVGQAASPSAGHAEALPGNSSAHHHDHCDVAAASPRVSGAAILPAALGVGVAFSAGVLPSWDSPSVGAVAVLAYAPKQSPPV